MPATCRAFLFFALALPAFCQDWQKLNSGPFEIYTSTDVKGAKNLLGTLEQLRGQLADFSGNTSAASSTDPAGLKPLWPIRILIGKNLKATPLTLTTGYNYAILPDTKLPPSLKRQIATVLLHPNSGPLEPGLEAALLSILSTLESDKVRVTLGILPPPAEQTRDWLLLEYLLTNEIYRGRVRVYLSNLMKGTDKPTALRSAFEKDEATLFAEAEAARPTFKPINFSARPILPERDFRARDVEAPAARLQLAIAELADPALREASRRTCSPLAATEPEAQECVVVSYYLSNDTATAQAEAEKAIAAGSQSPRILYIAATTQPERLKHQQQLFTALQLKPTYPEAALAFASKERDPIKAYNVLKTASAVALRDIPLLTALAKWSQTASLPAEAAKAWAMAERAAFEPTQREALRQSRLGAQDARFEAEARARREAEEAKKRDIERVKQESMARVRTAEAKARGQMNPLDPNAKIEQWWDGEQGSATVSGSLFRVDCVGGGKARFAVRDETKKVWLLDVPEPHKIILSGGPLDFSCGLQKKPRNVSASYFPNKTPKAPIQGKLVSMDFLP